MTMELITRHGNRGLLYTSLGTGSNPTGRRSTPAEQQIEGDRRFNSCSKVVGGKCSEYDLTTTRDCLNCKSYQERAK